MKVSWQVTGVRIDPWAEARRIEVEERKNADERGHTCIRTCTARHWTRAWGSCTIHVPSRSASPEKGTIAAGLDRLILSDWFTVAASRHRPASY
jgi:hypothetical protein